VCAPQDVASKHGSLAVSTRHSRAPCSHTSQLTTATQNLKRKNIEKVTQAHECFCSVWWQCQWSVAAVSVESCSSQVDRQQTVRVLTQCQCRATVTNSHTASRGLSTWRHTHVCSWSRCHSSGRHSDTWSCLPCWCSAHDHHTRPPPRTRLYLQASVTSTLSTRHSATRCQFHQIHQTLASTTHRQVYTARLPAHVTPSPWKPGRQVHVTSALQSPGNGSWHLANLWQPPFL